MDGLWPSYFILSTLTHTHTVNPLCILVYEVSLVTGDLSQQGVSAVSDGFVLALSLDAARAICLKSHLWLFGGNRIARTF